MTALVRSLHVPSPQFPAPVRSSRVSLAPPHPGNRPARPHTPPDVHLPLHSTPPCPPGRHRLTALLSTTGTPSRHRVPPWSVSAGRCSQRPQAGGSPARRLADWPVSVAVTFKRRAAASRPVGLPHGPGRPTSDRLPPAIRPAMLLPSRRRSRNCNFTMFALVGEIFYFWIVYCWMFKALPDPNGRWC